MGLWFYRGTVADRLLRESPDEVFIVHRDHEPADRAVASWTAPVLWRFGYGGEATESARGLAQSKTWRGLQRFMESLLGVAAVHWDHERCTAGARPAMSARTWLSALRFMESLLGLDAVHWEYEPESVNDE